MHTPRSALLATALIASMTASVAQPRPVRLCFANAQEALAAHPDGKTVADLKASAENEIKPIADQLRSLQARIAAGTATSAERQQFDTLQKTLQATEKRWQTRIQKGLEPITKDIDAALRATANAEGCAVVMDAKVAQSSGLVVYADDDTNITPELVKRLKK